MKKPLKKTEFAPHIQKVKAPSATKKRNQNINADQQSLNANDGDSLPGKYTELYDFAPTGFFTLDRNASICELNLTAALLLGQERSVLSGKDFRQFFTGDARKTFESFFKRLFELNVKTSCDVALDNFFNCFLYVHIEGIVISQGSKCLLVVADISERHKAEAELRTRDKIFSLSLDMHGIAGFDGYFKVLNPSWTRVLGWSTEALLASPWIGFVHPDDKENTSRVITTVVPDEMLRFECRFLCSDGAYKRLEFNSFSNPSEKTIISIARDITDKEKSEEKINAERNLLRTLIDHIPDAIYVKDRQARKIITNTMDLQLMGQLSETTVLGKTDLEIFPGDTGLESFNDDIHVLDTGEALLNKEEIFYDHEGRQLCVLTSKLALRNEIGEITGLLGIGRDFTARKVAENELLRLNQDLNKRAEELIASNQELEHFAYIASHDLQEPLRMVSSFLQLLKKNYDTHLDEKAQQYIHFAVDGANRMKVLIMDLLEYSKVGTNKEIFDNTDLNLVMQDVASNFMKGDETSEASIIYPVLPVIYANKSQMHQLMQNLVGNAIKYKGTDKPRIAINFREDSDHFVFSVKDNGIGIDPANFQNIFILFHRLHLKEEYSGTGIGLAICKKIVERHGGNIWVESEKGKGTTFYFTIRKLA